MPKMGGDQSCFSVNEIYEKGFSALSNCARELDLMADKMHSSSQNKY